jgi:hypothetical protein
MPWDDQPVPSNLAQLAGDYLYPSRVLSLSWGPSSTQLSPSSRFGAEDHVPQRRANPKALVGRLVVVLHVIALGLTYTN